MYFYAHLLCNMEVGIFGTRTAPPVPEPRPTPSSPTYSQILIYLKVITYDNYSFLSNFFPVFLLCLLTKNNYFQIINI